MPKQFSDAEVEWAAWCLFHDIDPLPKGWAFSDFDLAAARRALAGGYVPPPRPKTAREQMTDIIRSIQTIGFYTSRSACESAADALLARWPGIARVIEEDSR